MQVYKAFYKIILARRFQLLIYIFIFLFFAVFLARTSKTTADFTQTKTNVAFINQDADTELMKGLKNHLSNYANFIDLPQDEKSLQDALFFRKIETIIYIPKGFTSQLLAGEPIKLEKTTVPDSSSGLYIENAVNKYLNTANLYIKSLPEISQQQLTAHIERDLSHTTPVEIKSLGTSKYKRSVYYFNYMSYSLSAILILAICSIMLVFNKKDLRRRNLCSPVKVQQINFQLLLSILTFAVGLWLIMLAASFILYGAYMFTINGLLFMLNSFVFTLSALSTSFLIANIINGEAAASAAANVVSLGSAFISGTFVPQELLGQTVLNIAAFTPNYWYIKTNDQIFNLAIYNSENLLPIFTNILIVLGFALATLSITLVVIKQKVSMCS